MLAKALAFILLATVSRAAPSVASIAESSAASVSSAAVESPVIQSGTVESSQIRLQAQDAAGALADAETAIANGGGADAYAARADAERALGRPIEQVEADYAEAARLDPRYLKTYQGLVDEQNSELSPRAKTGGKMIKNGANVMATFLAFATLSGLVLLIALILLRGRKPPAASQDHEPPKNNGPA